MVPTPSSSGPSPSSERGSRTAWLVWAHLMRLTAASLMTALLVMHQRWPVPALDFVGLFALVIFGGVLFRIQVRRDRSLPISAFQAERLAWITAILALAGVQLVHRALGPEAAVGTAFLALAPVTAQALLMTALAGPTASLVSVTLVALLLGVSGAASAPALAVAWVSGAAASHLLRPTRRRSDLLRSLAFIALVQAGTAAACSLALGSGWPALGESALWAAVAAVIAVSIFWMGAAVLERLLGVTSEWSLLELCSPDHPLIRDLCLRAPGTYAHSVMVGTLAEAGARAIGANPVVCRAMAVYHDIGKINRPSCFIENQSGSNIHDSLSPAYSAQIIIGHIEEGVELAKKHGLPEVIIDGIRQHHGTSLLAPFYHKASQNGAQPIDEAVERLFRYPGPKPQSKEAALLHLADMTEAASRTLDKDQDPADLIAALIEKSRAEGQLDECDLTFRDLRDIREAFALVVTAVRHDRIAYPGQESLASTQDQRAEPVRQSP